MPWPVSRIEQPLSQVRSAFYIHVNLAKLGFSIARILWGFDLYKARDEKGNEIDVDTFAYTDGEGLGIEIYTHTDVRL